MAKKMNLLLTISLAVICLIALLCATLLPVTTARAAEYKYVYNPEHKLGSADNVDKTVVLVGAAGGKTYALVADNQSVKTMEVTIENNTITSPTTISNNILWTIGKSGSAYTYKSVSTGNYINMTGYSGADGAVSLNSTAHTFASGNTLKSTSVGTGMYEGCYSLYIKNDGSVISSGDYSTTINAYEQQEATTSTVTITKYEKFDITNTANFKIGDSVSGMLVATYSGNPYAMTMYSATSTSPNKALFVQLDGDTLTAINTNTNSNAEASRKMSTNIEDWMTWTVTRTAAGVTLQTDSTYSSAKGKYVSMGNYNSFSTVADSTVFSMTAVTGGFNLKNSSSYSIKLDSISNFSGNTTTSGTAATFTFYKKSDVEITNPVTISFDKGNDSAIGAMDSVILSQDTETTYTLPACGFTYTNYKFVGWKVNAEATVLDVGDQITLKDKAVDNAITLTAVWEYNAWNLTFKMDGQADKVIPVVKGTQYTFVDNTNSSLWGSSSTPQGKLFSCWTDGTETYAKDAKITPAADLEFTAVFANAVTVSFWIDYDSETGEGTKASISDKLVLPNGNVNMPYSSSSPTKTGYIFKGWSPDGGTTVIAAGASYTVGEDDVKMVAVWQFDGFTITFMVGEEVYATKTYAKVTEQYNNYSYYYAANGIEAPTAPAGQVFNGWVTTSYYNSNNKYSVYNSSTYSSSYLTLPRENSYGGITNYNVVLTADFAIAAVFKFQNEDGTVYKTETKTLALSATNVNVYLSTSYAGTIPSGYGLVNWTDEDNNVYVSGDRVYIYSTDTVYEKTLTVHYGRTVTISFDFNGGQANSLSPTSFPESKTYEYAAGTQQSITTSYNPERTNYTLTGWKCGDLVVKSGEKFTVADEDMCFVAQWKYDGITLTFNDGTNSSNVELASGTTSYTIAVDDPTVPEGQKFLGWQIEGDDSGTLYSKTGANKIIAIDGDEMTLNAVYRDLKTYNVTLHYGTTSKTVQYVEDTKNIQFNAATFTSNEMGTIDSDHMFMGWYKEDTFTTQMSSSFLVADDSFEDLHLYAKVEAYFWVHFDYGFKANASDETNIIVDKRAVEGSQGVVTLYSGSGADYHAKEKYTLKGWATTEGGAVVYEATDRTYITSACTLYAVWDYNYYVVTIKLAGSSEPVGTVEVAKNRNGNTLIKINELTDSNDALVINWTQVNVEGKDATWTVIKGDDSRDTALNEQITLTGDITLQVRFTDHLYTITVNWLGGKLAEIKQAYNTDVTAPETDKVGYEFVSFYLNNEQGGEYTFDKMPSQDIVVWAKYEILDSTLTFDTGDGGTTIAAVTAKTGSMVDKPADPTKEGYAFVKWQIDGKDVTWLVKDGTSTNPEYYINMPGGSTTMVAKWELTAEGLAALKTAKLAELDAYVAEKGVDLAESYSNAINNATTEAGVNEAYDAAIAKVDELKAEKDAAAQALADAKTAAKAEVAAKAAEDGVTAPSTADIDAATTIDAVNTAKAAALAAIAQAKADKDAAAAAEAASKAKVAAAQAKINALNGKKGAELFAAIAEATAAKDALTADEKAQLDMTAYTAAKTAYDAYVAAVNDDLNVASDIAMSVAAVKLASAVTAIAALVYVLKRRAL